MRQNGTNGVTPTRRIVPGGGLSAALWRLGAHARADTPAPAAQGISTSKRRRRGFKSPRLRPNRLRPTPMSRGASPQCLRWPTKRRWFRQCGSGATSRGSFIRWTTAGSPSARHHPHPARPHRPCCVRRRQSGQMAARIGYPRTPGGRSGNLVSGGMKRLTLGETLRAKLARQSRFKRQPDNDG